MEIKKPVPPFNYDSAVHKVMLAERAWNSRNPEIVCMAYTLNTEWRNRSEIISGREEVKVFLANKWKNELSYKLKKELWAFTDNRIAVRFEYEWHDHKGQWFRSFGNELWEFDKCGLMEKRFASIYDLAIDEKDRIL
jgi:nuclear transport factor 2 (NTF2) superfamily protein